MFHYILQCEAPKIAKLVYNSLWFMVLITIVNGAYKPTNITRGPHIVSPMVLVSIVPELVINQPGDVHQLYPGFFSSIRQYDHHVVDT